MTVMANETPQIPPALGEAAIHDLVEMIDLLAAARDAMSDEIMTRLARTVSEGMALLDRLTRNRGLMRLLQALDRPDCQHLLIGLADAIGETSRDLATAAPARGGIGEMLRLAREPGTQEGIRMLSLLGRHLSENLRELHQRDG
ncbi:MAG: hypothetical protein KGJ12_00450 [Gammaproteobacteria bacterium]|nr:hypothetical protein [Gammaproteobacteria bacterium]